MFNTLTAQALQSSSGLGMPVVRERVASTRALPVTTGVVCPANADWKAFDGTGVSAYAHIIDVVDTGAFPGASAWSPPS